MEFHTLTGILDLMTGDDFKDFCDDIAEHGLLEPIWTFQDQVIDGRNRYRACEATGVEPVYREWQGEEDGVLAFILSVNLHRRHLTVSQRAMLATKVLPIMKAMAQERQVTSRVKPGEHGPQARRSSGAPGAPRRAVDEAGKVVGVSGDSVRKAQRVAEEGSPALRAAVTQGTLSINQAAPLVSLSSEEQLRAIQEAEAAPRKPGRDPKKVQKQIKRTVAKLFRQCAVYTECAVDDSLTPHEAVVRFEPAPDPRRTKKQAA